LAFHADRLSLTPEPHADRRAALFREGVLEKATRWSLALAWSMAPARLSGFPNVAKLCFAELLAPDYALPDPERAYDNPPGLAGIVHEFSLPTILAGYRRGLYPLAHIAPMKWWSPPQRSMLFFNNLHIAKRLRRQMRHGDYIVSFDRHFEGVIKACSGHRAGRWHVTWITPKVMRVYVDAFDAGYAHSFEVWNNRGDLVGGGYGVAIGGAFITESQFSHEPNTSKIGFSVLNWHLAHWGYAFNDGKVMTPPCHDMGFRDVPRADFLARLAHAEKRPGKSGRWQMEADAAAVADWQPN
jgi:leucyl/phenylalanyl-tRNA---protein transferase